MTMFREFYWYRFGLEVGLRNLQKNGWRLGRKKTLGKILQPINAYTRFPEYDRYCRIIEQFMSEIGSDRKVRILDVGSPKLFGLYLALHYDVEIYLSDISRLNIDEYVVLWEGLKDRARGRVIFEQQDARSLTYLDGEFDIVYSMSVIEHIEGDNQDVAALNECLRVLRPQGLLIVSFPFGPYYLEQQIVGANYVVGTTKSDETFFFQRIYDLKEVEQRIVPTLTQQGQFVAWTQQRAQMPLLRIYHWARARLGQDINGLLGFLNPILSTFLNVERPGIDRQFFASYQKIHTLCDIYGDLVLALRKHAPRLSTVGESKEALL